MQVYLVALGTHGDVLPFIALAVEFRARGYEVVLAAPATFGPAVSRAGVPFHALGTPGDYENFIAEPHLWRPWRGVRAVFRFTAAMAKPTYEWLTDGAHPAQRIVVASTLSVGARVAQDKFDQTLVIVHVMPFIVESRHAPPVLPSFPLPNYFPPRLRHWLGRGADKYVIGPAILPPLNAFRATLELSPVRRIRHWWNLGSRVILMFPEWYALPQEDWPANAVQVGFPISDLLGDATTLGSELCAFLDAGTPPIAFTYGSGMRKSRPFFETAMRICRRMRRRGVFLAPQGGQVPAHLPADVMHLSYAPLSKLLPRCAAIVHHGGVGTVAQAMLAGVPQLIVPVAFNHFDEVVRVKRLGVGTALTQRRFRPAVASKVLQRLIDDPVVSKACSHARGRMLSEDGVGAACDAIEELMPRPVRDRR